MPGLDVGVGLGLAGQVTTIERLAVAAGASRPPEGVPSLFHDVPARAAEREQRQAGPLVREPVAALWLPFGLRGGRQHHVA